MRMGPIDYLVQRFSLDQKAWLYAT
jgi:hypothetical protein